MHIPRRQWSRRPPPNTEPVHLTQEGLNKLKNRLERLKYDLPAAAEEAARTAAYGDRSDNAEYKEAKSALRRMHRQIAAAEDQLRRVVLIPDGPDASGKVRLGATVTLERNKKEQTYHIVGPSETDPGKGRISHTSPLGAALVGHAAGDEISIKTPRGTTTYKITKVA